MASKKKFLSLFPEKFKGISTEKVKVIIPEYPVSYNGHNQIPAANSRVFDPPATVVKYPCKHGYLARCSRE